jgi:membrane-associated phospholipid phosphatase
MRCPLCRVLAPPAAWFAGGVLLFAAALLWLDAPVAAWGLAHRHQPAISAVCHTLAPLGSGIYQPALLGLALLAFATLRRWSAVRAVAVLLLVFVLAGLLATGLKTLVRRPRPEHDLEARPPVEAQLHSGEWHSFPSGDVLVTSALCATLFGLAGRRRRWQWLLWLPLLVALQRLGSARHHLSDVLAAALLGYPLGALAGWCFFRRPAPTATGDPCPD